MEKEVEQFAQDEQQTQYNFGPRLTSYQRLLTNKISQYWGLQIRIGDYTLEGPGQIQAIKPTNFIQPEIKLGSLKPIFTQTNQSPIILQPKQSQTVNLQRAQTSQIQAENSMQGNQKLISTMSKVYAGQDPQAEVEQIQEAQQIDNFYDKGQVHTSLTDGFVNEQPMDKFQRQQDQLINPQTLHKQYQTSQILPNAFETELSPTSSLQLLGIQSRDLLNPQIVGNQSQNYFQQKRTYMNQNNAQINIQSASQASIPPIMPLNIQIPGVQQGSASQYPIHPQISPQIYPLTPPPQFQTPQLSQSSLGGSQNNLLYQNQPNQMMQNQSMMPNNYSMQYPQMYYVPPYQTPQSQNSQLPLMNPMDYQIMHPITPNQQFTNQQYISQAFSQQQYASQQFINAPQMIGNQYMIRQQGSMQGNQIINPNLNYPGPSNMSANQSKSSSRNKSRTGFSHNKETTQIQEPFQIKQQQLKQVTSSQINLDSFTLREEQKRQTDRSLPSILPTPEKSGGVGVLRDSDTGTSTQIGEVEQGQDLIQGQETSYTLQQDSIYGEASGTSID